MSKRIVRVFMTLTLVAACVLAPPRAAAQQGGTTRYVYDSNGRLHAVVSPAGEAAIYEYDAAGNFTAIRRLGAETLTLLAFYPQEGGAGDLVTLVGVGFGLGVNQVSFNGSPARVVEVSPSAVIAQVPDEATTGPITISTPRGAVTTQSPFTIVSRVRVLPSTATVMPGDSVAFTAVVGGGGDQSVMWSVNGINGGNANVGTISAMGLYTAPSLTGNQSLLAIVRATSSTQESLFGEAQVRVLNPNNLGSLFALPVSVRRGDLVGGPTPIAGPLVSVRSGVVMGDRASILSPIISLRRGAVIDTPVSVFGPAVSIRNGAVTSNPLTIPGSIISVRRGLAGGGAIPISSLCVSLTNGPNISAISPGNVVTGSTVTLTISGANLGGANALKFIDANGAIDPSIAVANLSVDAGGASLTATVTVGGSTAPGQRVVLITTPAGNTPAIKVGSNTITIIQ